MGWSPEVAETVTGDAVYTAVWSEDKNDNGKPDDTETKFTVTYTDGVESEEIFADQITANLLSGTKTPAFSGMPTREGHVFMGWSPEVAETVTGDAVYTAQWQKVDEPVDPDKPVDPDQPTEPSQPTEPNPPADGEDSSPNTPQTGDSSSPILWIALLLTGISGLAGTLILHRRRDNAK